MTIAAWIDWRAGLLYLSRNLLGKEKAVAGHLRRLPEIPYIQLRGQRARGNLSGA